MHVVVNHLRFRDAVTDATVEALRGALQLVMREHIVPLLSGGTERSLGEVIASAPA
jgi:hypothetical protein